MRQIKKAPESCDPEAPVENGFKRPQLFASSGVLHTSASATNTDELVDISSLLLRTRLFCRSQVPYQAPPLSDGGLFSSTLGAKRQAPPSPCFILDKKLTISCRYPGPGAARPPHGLLAAAFVAVCRRVGQGEPLRGPMPGDSCALNPHRLYCARCKQGVWYRAFVAIFNPAAVCRLI